ncbi:MAG: zinc ribbon domain-containing protein [Planctomycetes bacterium]|nr:zinc ribbon domain-containing protein [Planctomycetota bacterium]
MYCSECGTKAQGKFCANCGVPLQQAITAEIVAAIVSPGHWQETVNYETIVRAPEVREMVTRAAEQATQRLSGEDFLKFCDKALAPLYGGVPVGKLASIAQPIYSALGMNTGKEQRRVFSKPPGRVIVALLCSLARRGRPLRQIRQATDGCMFEATLPSDVWSFAGDLLVEVRTDTVGTAVEARTVVKGQLFDWGKSKRCLEELLTDLEMTPAIL